MTQKVLLVLRWIYAAFFLLISLQSVLVSADILPKSESPASAEIKAFTVALFDTGFILPIMTITCVVTGILMLITRTSPLRIVLLAPVVVVILFTHLMLNGNPLWGILIAGLLLVFAWQFRSAYKPMRNYNRGIQHDG